MKEQTAKLLQDCLTLGFSISEDEGEQIVQFLDLTAEASRYLNLTSIPRKDALELHALDSLTLLPFLPQNSSPSLLDLGTGAGFPGIPLAIVRPDMPFTLVDAREKKLEFVRKAALELQLENVRTTHGRAEDLGRDRGFREEFDIVCARAFAPLPQLLELCSPFVRVGGKILAMKGQAGRHELEQAKPALDSLSLRVHHVHAFCLPESQAERCILVFEKTGRLDEKFPRSAKEMKKTRKSLS